MCHHTWFRFSQDAHGYRMSKQASDESLVEIRFLGDLFKRDLAASGDHVQNLEPDNRVNADDIRDLENISFIAPS